MVDATVLPPDVPGAMVYTDDWNGYKPLSRNDRGHATVNHNRGEFARDDDGDGVREVHCNTLEGIWTGPRNFLRSFVGVDNLKESGADFIGWSLKEVKAELVSAGRAPADGTKPKQASGNVGRKGRRRSS